MAGGVIKPVEIRAAVTPANCARAAKALILAATLTLEVGRLIKHDEAALSGRVVLKARWIAFAALSAAGEEPIAALGRALGCGPTPFFLLERQRATSGWREDLVVAVTVALLCDEAVVAPAGVERQMAAAMGWRP